MKPDASKLSAWRTAEVYGHDWVEEREDQARGEESGVRSSSHSAWKEIKEEDSIMMVVQESRSSETAGLFGTRRRTRKGRMLEERHEPERKAEDSSISNETTCDWERRQKLHDHLHNVVLIMNFNWGWIAEKSMDFWKRVYGPIFDNIVFVSKDVLPEIGLEGKRSHSHDALCGATMKPVNSGKSSCAREVWQRHTAATSPAQGSFQGKIWPSTSRSKTAAGYLRPAVSKH